jgi:hypothetical protein
MDADHFQEILGLFQNRLPTLVANRTVRRLVSVLCPDCRRQDVPRALRASTRLSFQVTRAPPALHSAVSAAVAAHTDVRVSSLRLSLRLTHV